MLYIVRKCVETTEFEMRCLIQYIAQCIVDEFKNKNINI